MNSASGAADPIPIGNELYRQIVESSPNAVLFMDNSDIIQFWNKGAEQIFGWPASEIIGKHISVIIPENLLELGEIDCIREGLESHGGVTDYETERLTRDKRIVFVYLTETRIRDQRGKIIGKSQIIRDMSEHRILQNQMWQSEKLATIGHLAAGVAHEIGNPLTSMASIVQIMNRRTDNRFMKESLAKIRKQIDRISVIVRELINFSRPSPKRQSLTQINDLIESAVGLLKYDSRAKHLNFDLFLEKNLPLIVAVPDQVYQVLVNIIINSVDAMQEKGTTISVFTKSDSSHITIIIEDDGTGIEKPVQRHIFEPFFTTKDVGKGTGLGLSVSHGIISNLDGEITVDSAPGLGATFTIKIPLDRYRNES